METQFEVAISMAALGVSFAALWWGTTRIRRRAMRTIAQFLILPVLTVAVALPVRALIAIPFERGEWSCTVCGVAEDQIHLGSIPILHRPKPDLRRFTARYLDEVHEPHRHDWARTGHPTSAVSTSRDVSVETVLQTGTWILGILLPFAGAWFATSWFRRSPSTRVARILLSGSVAFFASPWIHMQAMEPISRAIWRCSVCGASEYQVRFWDRAVYRSGKHATAYKQLGASAATVPHEHDWLFWLAIIAYGDQDFMCTCGLESEGDVYFSCLDKMPSPEIARGMIDRVSRASVEERSAMIHVFDTPELGEPFVSLYKGVTPTREQFEREYVAWLDRHPEWK